MGVYYKIRSILRMLYGWVGHKFVDHYSVSDGVILDSYIEFCARCGFDRIKNPDERVSPPGQSQSKT